MLARIGWLLVCCLQLALIGVAAAQPTRKVARIGYLAAVSATADAPRLESFRKELRELGYVEGQNLLIDYRHLDRDFDRLPALAAELVGGKIDVLVSVT